MNIGKLDQRIAIYQNEVIVNDLNEDQPAPALLKRVWANVQPRTGSLMSGRPADTMLSKTTHVVTVRSEVLKNITTDCYILWTDANGQRHRFDIDYILPPVRLQPTSTIYVQEVI